MSLPGNGIFVVQGEMAMLVTAMRRSTRWGSHSFPNEEYDVLMRTFQDLKIILNQVDDLRLLDPATYLSPFLEVIRSKETTGPVTSLALSAIHKFLSYGLIDPTHPSVPAIVEDIADAVTHARFVGTDHSSDGVVLMKILQVLRTLMLSPEGVMLTDESVCEIMLSCFRICFETRLTELLRRNAEQCLRDMTQLIFMRLPQFPPEDAASASFSTIGLSLKKRDKTAKKKSLTSVHSTNSLERNSSMTDQGSASATEAEAENELNKPENILRHNQDKNLINEAEITIEPVDPVKTPSKKHGRHSSMDLASQNTSITQLLEKCVSSTEPEIEKKEEKEENSEEQKEDVEVTDAEVIEQDGSACTKPTAEEDSAEKEKLEEYVNHRGIRFTPQDDSLNLQPYGLVCVRELFRFLISLCNPLDAQNTSGMVHLGLALAGTALEVAADQLQRYPSLFYLVKDPLARNLLSLLGTERISIFALDLQVSFLLFEALRFQLKFQLEAFFKKIIEIISMDTSKAIYELKEIQHLALESLAQLFRIPGFCTELYLNYDCDVYSMNVFEELTKLLSKNVISSTAYNIHSLSLEVLLTIIDAIEMGTQPKIESKSEIDVINVEEVSETKYGRGGHVTLELGGLDDASVVSDHVTHDISQYFVAGRTGRHKSSSSLPTEAELDNIRNMKKWVTQGTELFNQKPERGIEFLQEHGVLKTPLDPHEIAIFLRENPDLDKKMIGEYICKRSSRGEEECEGGGGGGAPSVLGAFADSFEYTGLRIDQALRLYLETFRLPGEAPLIFLVMEKFAERWHSTNGEPFANTDAAFRLAYAVIMLNMDQHNHNAKKLNVPMTVEDFIKNLRGCNGTGDFDQAMLEAVYTSIKNEEMVMPAERVGPVRDAYLWRVLQRRGLTAAARYRAAPPHHPHHARLFTVVCPSAVPALSAAFERAAPPTPEEIESNNTRESAALLALNGLERCAGLVARAPLAAPLAAPALTLTLDTLLLTLCKFTGLQAVPQQQQHCRAIGVTLGQSSKAQLALRRACAVAARHADCVREAWKYLLDIVTTLFVGRLLPKSLVEVEDYLAPNGSVSLIREASRGSEAGLLSSLYSYIALGESGIRTPTPHEKSLIDIATDCVSKCNLPGLLVTETKFLQLESLQELVRAMIAVGSPADAESLQLNPLLEDITIFYLELLEQTLIQNRDRLLTVWDEAGPHIRRVVMWSATRGSYALGRSLTALLRSAARLMRCETCAAPVLRHLRLLLQLPHQLCRAHAHAISCGLYDVVKTSAQNVHSADEWRVLLALLCACGAGAWPAPAAPASPASPASPTPHDAQNTASSRSEGSEDEGERRPTSASSESELSQSPQQGWILVKNEAAPTVDGNLNTGWWEDEQISLRGHKTAALARCCEALALVVRDVAHVTPYNCRAAVRAVRIFARATLHDAKKTRDSRKQRPQSRGRDESSDEEVDTLDQYHLISIQLLDLMHTLHSRTAQIFKWWRDEADQGQNAEEYDLWEVAWMPLLQGIAEFCTDRRKQVSNSAIAYLQRALLVPGLSPAGGGGGGGGAGGAWEACFERVLFPLLERLPRRAQQAARANTIMCKVFLQHLSALSPRSSFASLWLRVVRVQAALATGGDDALTEAALESLKNMILVMDSVRIFTNGESYNELWYITWEKIGEFLPNLKNELFPQVKDDTSSLPSAQQQPTMPSVPTLVPPTSTTPTSLLPPHPLIPQQSQQTTPQHIPSSNFSHIPSPTLGHPTLAPMSPVELGQSPPRWAPTLAAPAPVSGMVPIRNPLYEQAGLTSSVLLQPLNEMISTPIGISIQSQMPILYPQTTTELLHTQAPPDSNKTELTATVTQPILTQPNLIENILPDKDVNQSELYAEYLTNPYNETKDLSAKEATLYDPGSLTIDQTVPESELRNPLLSVLDKQKALSTNTTPMHNRNKSQFGSTDNLRPDSGIFNFSSYFSAVNERGSEVFDTLMSTQEG